MKDQDRMLDLQAKAIHAIREGRWFHAEQLIDDMRRLEERINNVQHGPLCRRCFCTGTTFDKDTSSWWCPDCDDFADVEAVTVAPVIEVHEPVYSTLAQYFEENPREKGEL